MNIAYTIWIESLESPIIKSQVLEVLKVLKKISPKNNYYFFAFQPLTTIFFHYKKLLRIKEDLKNNNIKLIIIPSLVTPRLNWFKAKWYLLPPIFLQTFTILLLLSILKNIDVLHCRSYPVMLGATVIKQMNKGLKIIFDPRSPFPEENITAKRWTEDSISYKMWKILERKFLDKADITIAIADTYVKHFSKISAKAQFMTIPNNIDVAKYSFCQDYRNYFRSERNVKDNETIFAYVGSLGNHWNNPSIYAKFIICLRKLDIDHRFLFITPNILKLKEVFKEYDIKDHEYFIVSANPSEVPKYLSAADIGLNIMDMQDIRMSIKTCEYLAIGLPVLVNLNVKGATEIVEKYHVGLILEDLNNINFEDIKEIVLKKDMFALKCRKVASENFSTIEVARRYIDVYNN